MLLSLSTLKGIMEDLTAGGIDQALYQLYTTNRSSTTIACDVTEHLRSIFHMLIYAEPEFCVKSSGSITLVDRAHKWWLPSRCLSHVSLERLKLICGTDYRIFTKKWTPQGVGSLDYWSGFSFRTHYNNFLMMRREMPPTALTSARICSMRAHFCERMIFVILLVNDLYTEREPHINNDIWDSTLTYIKNALLSLSLMIEREESLVEIARHHASLTEPHSIGTLDMPHSIHYYLSMLLTDEERLRSSARRFAEYHLSMQALDEEPQTSAVSEHEPATITDATHDTTRSTAGDNPSASSPTPSLLRN